MSSLLRCDVEFSKQWGNEAELQARLGYAQKVYFYPVSNKERFINLRWSYMIGFVF